MCSKTVEASEPAEISVTDFENQVNSTASTTQANAQAASNGTHGGAPRKKLFLVPGIASFLGHGYDIFGQYASPDSVRARIYDLPSEPLEPQPTVDQTNSLTPEQWSHTFTAPPSELRMVYSRPVRVGYTDIFQSRSEVTEITSSGKEKVKWGIGGTLDGGYGGFSGEITGRFDTKNTRLATTRCIQATSETIYWKLDVNNYTYENPPPISDEVRADFNKRGVEDLVHKYGTHCLEEIGIGTKIVHSYTIDTSKFSKSLDVTAALKAKYESGAFHAGLDVDGEYHDAGWNDRSAVTVKIHTFGTSDSQLAEITDLSRGLSEHPLSVLRQGWHNPTIIKFYPSSLRPIWTIEGLMTPEKAAQFEAYYKTRASADQAVIDNLFQGLQPLYLLSKTDAVGKKYRLEPTIHYGGWTLENDGKPWQFLSAIQKPGMVPLHELALNDDTDTVRYETDFWVELLRRDPLDGYVWGKTGRTVGYVYERRHPDDPVPENAVPVYAFYDREMRASRGIFYSFMKELVWDKGAWKPFTEVDIRTPERRRVAQAYIDACWNNESDWYRFWHVKPTLGSMSVEGFNPDTIDEAGLLLFSTGVPHWYSMHVA